MAYVTASVQNVKNKNILSLYAITQSAYPQWAAGMQSMSDTYAVAALAE